MIKSSLKSRLKSDLKANLNTCKTSLTAFSGLKRHPHAKKENLLVAECTKNHSFWIKCDWTMNPTAGEKGSIITPLVVIVLWNSIYIFIWLATDNVNFSTNRRSWIEVNSENEFKIEGNNWFSCIFTGQSKGSLYHYAMYQSKLKEFLYQLRFRQLQKAGRGNFPNWHIHENM